LADSVYWINNDYTESSIRCAPLDGSGPVGTVYAGPGDGLNFPLGMALDPAAGRIYWTSNGDDKIKRAPLDGSGPAAVHYGSDPAHGVSDPVGLTIDPAAGWLYWSQDEWDNQLGVVGKIRRAPLDGSGPVVTLYGRPWDGVFYPSALVVDPTAPGAPPERLDLGDTGRATVGRWLRDLLSRWSTTPVGPPGRIYWVDSGTIYWAPLTGGGVPHTLYAAGYVNDLVIDAAAGRIDWPSYAARALQGAPLDGRGPIGTLYDGSRGVSGAGGAAIDPNPADPGPARLEVADTERFAIGAWLRDVFSGPSASPGLIYWGNGPSTTGGQPLNPNDNRIRRAPLDGSGPFEDLYDSANDGVSQPRALALLRAPLGTGPPTISYPFLLPDEDFQFGGGHSGPLNRELSCSRGAWAPDLPSSHLYRAPRTFAYQWRLGGNDIPGANAARYTPTAPGSYACRVTATNQAGGATQTSAPFTVS
jgi:hypothetical protein